MKEEGFRMLEGLIDRLKGRKDLIKNSISTGSREGSKIMVYLKKLMEFYSFE